MGEDRYTQMFSWFKSKPKPTLADNPHFKLYQKNDIVLRYKWNDAPVFTTKLKAKRAQKIIGTRTEVVGKSHTLVLGTTVTKVMTKDVEETTTRVKYSVEQTPEMEALVSQILEELKDEEVKFNEGRLLGTLSPEEETHEVQVVPLIEKSIAGDWYAIFWLLVRNPTASSSEDPVNEKEKPVLPPPKSLPDHVIRL